MPISTPHSPLLTLSFTQASSPISASCRSPRSLRRPSRPPCCHLQCLSSNRLQVNLNRWVTQATHPSIKHYIIASCALEGHTHMLVFTILRHFRPSAIHLSVSPFRTRGALLISDHACALEVQPTCWSFYLEFRPFANAHVLLLLLLLYKIVMSL